VVVIGPVTKKVAESLGVRVDGVATEPNPQGIVDALAKLMGDCP
jgi:uroporphyrinogen-III synthase